MKDSARQRFDREFERVLARLPQSVRDLIDEVPLFVEDHPSTAVMRQMGVERRDELCGLYSGVPLDERGIDLPGRLPDVIFIYRLGILAMAKDDDGVVSTKELRRQIRITILHELAHHHGIGEHELEALGFD
jgi:predicted Zn-dependent protease with MMP-like domain